jgi:hypothetical protein
MEGTGANDRLCVVIVEPGKEAPHLDPSCEGSFRDNNLFVGQCFFRLSKVAV